MSWIGNIQKLGIKPELPRYLQSKTLLANRLALVLTVLFALYSVLASFYVPGLTSGISCSLLVFAVVVLLNYLELHTISRFILSTSLAVICLLLHIRATNTAEEVLAGFIALQVAALVLPWIVFDARETLLLWGSSLVGLTSLLLVHYLPAWLASGTSMSELNVYSLDFFLMLTAALILLFGLFMLNSENKAAEQENQAIMAEMHAREGQAKENESKMNDYITEIEKNQEESKKRQWASDGLARFTELLRRQDNVKDLADEIIAQLVKYVGANQGGLFILRDETKDHYLELLACYAYNRKKYIDRKIAIGEGLIGQAYLEEDKIYLTDIPDNYVRITSGLGDANPRSILIVPLKMNDKVLGVIELASFKAFETYHMEFIDKLCENIASVISNVKINETTRKLLEESQQQAEELRAQEEEMRQNFEELQATQEEMERKQRENIRLLEEAQIKEKQLQEQAHEIERIKEEEKAKMIEMQNRQRNYVQMIMEKSRQKEEELTAQLKDKDKLLNQLQINHSTK